MLWQCSAKGPVRFRHKNLLVRVRIRSYVCRSTTLMKIVPRYDTFCRNVEITHAEPTNLTCPGFVETHDANNLKETYFAFAFSRFGC